MGGAFLHKKSLLDQFKDDYAMMDPIKARRAERSWGNPIVRHKREKGIQDWAKSFAGKRHYRKLMRFNAMRSEAFNAKEFNKFYDKVIDALLDIYDEDTIKEIVDEYPFIERWDDKHYRTVDDVVADIKDWLGVTERVSVQKACDQHQEAKQAKRIYPKFVQINTQRDFDKYIKPALGRGADAYGLSDIEGMWWEIADGERVPASAKTMRKIRDSVSKRPRFIFISGVGAERGITDLPLTEYAEEMGMTVKEYLDGYDAGSWESKKSEDSLDDFDNRRRVSPSSKYITFSGLARGAVRDDVRRVLRKSGILDPQLGKPDDSVRFEFGVQNNPRSVCKALAALLELGERNTWYIKYSDGDSEHNRITMYSPDIPNDMWYAGDVDKIVSYIMPVKSEAVDETLSYEKGNKNSRGEDAPWVIRDHKGGKVLASFAKKADAEAHLERMQRYSKSESTGAPYIQRCVITGGTGPESGEESEREKIDVSGDPEQQLWDMVLKEIPADYEQHLFVNNDEYDNLINDDDVTALKNIGLDNFKKKHSINKITSMGYYTHPWSGMISDLMDYRIVNEVSQKSESLKKALHESRVKKLEKMGEAVDAITSRDVQAAARSAWSSSGAKDFKPDIVRLGDHVIIYTKGLNGEDDIGTGITWHVHIPSELNNYKTPHVEQFADWRNHVPERTYDAKDLDDLEDFLLDEFKALQETLDVTKENS